MTQNNLAEKMEHTAVQLGVTDRFERKALIKEALREGFKEWLDEVALKFGRWTLKGLAVAAFGAFIYFVLVHTGWVKL